MPTKKVTRKSKSTEMSEQAEDLQAKVAEEQPEAEETPKAAIVIEEDGVEASSEPSEAEAKVNDDKTAVADSEIEQGVREGSAEAAPKPLPKHLQDRLDAVHQLVTDVQQEVENFKSNEAYLEGDIPVTLGGVGGPGLQLGQRSLNYIDKKWLDPNKHFRWANKRMVDYHRGDGFAPSDYDEFTLMVKARGGGHTFQKTPEGHVQSGDLIMVETSQDWYQKLKAATAEKTARKEMRAKNTLYQKGEELGVEVYEGASAVGPKMEGLLSFLEKELGPGVREAFLGK